MFLKVRQVLCDARNLPPSGCLQYHTGLSGQVRHCYRTFVWSNQTQLFVLSIVDILIDLFLNIDPWRKVKEENSKILFLYSFLTKNSQYSNKCNTSHLYTMSCVRNMSLTTFLWSAKFFSQLCFKWQRLSFKLSLIHTYRVSDNK